MLDKLKSFFTQGNRAQWCVFVLFALTIFVKCVLFHWNFFNSLIISGLWNTPIKASIFYLPKIIVAILLGSFVFLSKRNWWTALLLLAIDIYCIAVLMYNNANNLLLDVPAILMAYNLRGFESSLSTFFHLCYLIFILQTILYTTLLFIINNVANKYIKSSFRTFCICCSIAILCNIIMCIPSWLTYYYDKADADFDMANGRKIIIQLYGKNGWRCFIPFHDVKMNALPELTYDPNYGSYYIYQNSILHYAVAMCVYYANSQQQSSTEIDMEKLHECFANQSGNPLTPQQNLIVILVESLESWPFEMGELSWQIVPNFMDLLQQQNAILFSSIRSEAKHGVSGDGQMLVSSGMMPINAGAACIYYGENEWPSYVSLFPHSVFVDCSNGAWNQRTMSNKYGYKVDSYNKKGRTDSEVFSILNSILDTIQSPYMTMALTSATHSPFNKHKGYCLKVPNDMPKFMIEYLECLHYTDSCFGIFWKKYKQTQDMQTILLVTGDHTVFKPAMLNEFHNFAKAYNINISATESFCPLIIHSTEIKENVQISDTCYQMDIYPTIMHLIGCENYYWKGFGVNLLDSTARHNRPISEQKAFVLSDKLIRSNYFETLQ